jgi:hypothetical protein
MSAELFHVIAQAIRRHTARHRTVPVCPRYDQHERTWCEPLPYLFQRTQSGTPRADLVARRQRATEEGWHGEIEGIDLTLSYLHGKRAQAQRAAPLPQVRSASACQSSAAARPPDAEGAS